MKAMIHGQLRSETGQKPQGIKPPRMERTKQPTHGVQCQARQGIDGRDGTLQSWRSIPSVIHPRQPTTGDTYRKRLRRYVAALTTLHVTVPARIRYHRNMLRYISTVFTVPISHRAYRLILARYGHYSNPLLLHSTTHASVLYNLAPSSLLSYSSGPHRTT